MEGTVETTTDEGEIANVFPSNTNWSTNTQNNTNGSNSTLLFIAVEYVGKEGGGDYKFETESAFSPQPSTYSEFDQHVSPLDPNMSSAARYSPVYSDTVDNSYNNSVVVLQDSVNPLISSEICQNAGFVNTTNASYTHLPSPASPLDSISSSLSTSDNNLLRQVVANRYLQMVTTNSGVEVDDASCGSAGSPVVDFNQRSPVDEPIIDKELQLVQFPVDSYSGLSMERNLKVDPDQVELLITDQNTGISYSGYVSQDFLVSRNPLPSLPALPDDEQHLTQVLNTLGTHGLVMEAQHEDLNEVVPQGASLAMGEGQMMLQDPLLDSDLLLQAPVEIALDDSVLSTNNTLVLKNNQATTENHMVTNLTSVESCINSLPLAAEHSPIEMVVCDSTENLNVKKEEAEDDEIKNEYEAQQLRRSKRSRQSMDDDLLLLNRVQTISDKPVPSRARATLPAPYLVINKLPAASDNMDPGSGVFARKFIPKRTQFGPLEGILMEENGEFNDNQPLKLLLEDDTGVLHRLDISNENSSNWMRFVRPAKTYAEQNLVLSQQGYSLYYTTTRTILPRQELLVGYSTPYATRRKVQVLEPEPEEENNWHCYECPSKFATSDEFQKHLNVHDENKEDYLKPRIKKIGRFKRRNTMDCPLCTRTFFKRYSLNRHLLSHTNPTARDRQMRQIKRSYSRTDTIDKLLQWKCSICNLVFSNPTLLNIHELVHKNSSSETITGLPLDLGSGCHDGEFLVQSGALQCPDCAVEFTSRKDLIEHVAEHGKKLRDGESTAETKKKSCKCAMCYKAFASRERLQRHMLVHGSEDSKPLKCDVCTKRFLNNSALACHLKTHKLDKKIFECPICKVAFDQVLMLKEHVKSHSVNGTYTCPHCSKIFKEYSIIRKHIRALHCDRKHGCQYCGKPFPTFDKLRMHLLKHSDHREFLCADCGKQFKRKDKLKEHMKRMHSADREPRIHTVPRPSKNNGAVKKFMPKVQPTDYHRFIYKCHTCLLGFKRRGMLVNHLAKRHPDISPESVPELNLPILKTTRDYYCQYCDKVYKSSSKRKAHILKNHPGSELPMSNRHKGGVPDIPGIPNPTFSQTVGSVTTNPHGCQWCHKQYASKAKLLQHQRKKHAELLPSNQKRPRIVKMAASPGIPEDSKYINSPDIPGDLGAMDTATITDENPEMTEDNISNMNSGYIECEDTKIIINENLKSHKLNEETIHAQTIDDLDTTRSNGQYYRIVEMPSRHITLSQASEEAEEAVDDPPESSRLYRLLTSNSPFTLYPPR